ncbi:hypothetical protein [Streptomyces sp. NPDC017993]|uniref:hypothetical protein n=1 Tax=Streptomyces sp. NPDC017993 TaxID=3365027 RepID=UPI0037901BFC
MGAWRNGVAQHEGPTRSGSVPSPTRALLRAFVEVDRATESSERLASKVITYARFTVMFPSRADVATTRRGCVRGSKAMRSSRGCCSC